MLALVEVVTLVWLLLLMLHGIGLGLEVVSRRIHSTHWWVGLELVVHAGGDEGCGVVRVEYTARWLKRAGAWGEAGCGCARLKLFRYCAHRSRCIGLVLYASI